MTLDLGELTSYITNRVVDELCYRNRTVPIGVSNRHIHLDRESMDILFGKGSELTANKALKQPGQYACRETVEIRGPKGSFSKVRVLGPLRPKTQVEISVTDSFSLGVKAPLRLSGDIAGTPGIEVIGPCGSLVLDCGLIVAMRHIHMLPEMADRLGLKNKQVIRVAFDGGRKSILDEVVMRVAPNQELEMHIDVDEANAVGARNDQLAVMEF